MFNLCITCIWFHIGARLCACVCMRFHAAAWLWRRCTSAVACRVTSGCQARWPCVRPGGCPSLLGTNLCLQQQRRLPGTVAAPSPYAMPATRLPSPSAPTLRCPRRLRPPCTANIFVPAPAPALCCPCCPHAPQAGGARPEHRLQPSLCAPRSDQFCRARPLRCPHLAPQCKQAEAALGSALNSLAQLQQLSALVPAGAGVQPRLLDCGPRLLVEVGAGFFIIFLFHNLLLFAHYVTFYR